MKLSRVLVPALCALTLAACGSGTTVGNGELTHSARPSPKESRPRPTRTTKSPEPVDTTPTQPVGPKPKTHTVTADSGYQFEPSDVFTRVGDTVLFKNISNNSNHSWTVREHEDEMDSGPVEPGAQARVKVDIAPGEYEFYCTVVPYMVGGRLVVDA